MEVISIREKYFCKTSFAEFLTIENISDPMVEPFNVPQYRSILVVPTSHWTYREVRLVIMILV